MGVVRSPLCLSILEIKDLCPCLPWLAINPQTFWKLHIDPNFFKITNLAPKF